MFSLDSKVVIITGAAGLLGRQHACAVASAGGIPILLDINSEKIEELEKDLLSEYASRACGYSIDITNELEIKRGCELIIKKFGRIDGLINNAANNPKVESGNESFTRLENFDRSSWEADLNVGLTGAFLCAKHFGLAISRQGGSILNVSSDLGLVAPDQRLYRQSGLEDNAQPVKPISYSVVKAGLLGLTRYIATYWADKGVRCNALCPGGVENGQSTEFIEAVNLRIPMGRMARPDDYMGAVVFLLSEASSYMNGSVLVIDGGRTAW